MTHPASRSGILVCLAAVVLGLSGCQWQGLNSVSLPGTEGGGPGSFEVKAELPDITNIERNSRVRVGDVTVGNVTNIELQGWHALVTMRLNGDVDLPANATAKVGQTSLLGSLHIELAPPTDNAPEGHLADGAVIPLAASGSFPTTEQTLAAISLLLNGGGLSQLRDITEASAAVLADGGGENLRRLLEQLTTFTGQLNAQTQDIITAADGINALAGNLAANQPVIDKALEVVPKAAEVLAAERDKLAESLDKTGQLAALTNATLGPTKDALVQQLNDLAPILKSLADAGPALTRSFDVLATFPYPREVLKKTQRGDYLNLSLVLDLTLSRLDGAILTGTRFEGKLTEWELQWGRTIGMTPSPYTAANPIVVPYHFVQGS